MQMLKETFPLGEQKCAKCEIVDEKWQMKESMKDDGKLVNTTEKSMKHWALFFSRRLDERSIDVEFNWKQILKFSVYFTA